MLEDQGKLAGELRQILLRNPSLWPPTDLTAATRGVAAAVQIDGGLGLWASDPAEATNKPYRTLRADSKPVYESPDPVQAAAVAAALNEVTWNQVKKATKFDIDHLAFLADLTDSRSLGWLHQGPRPTFAESPTTSLLKSTRFSKDRPACASGRCPLTCGGQQTESKRASASRRPSRRIHMDPAWTPRSKLIR